MLTNKVIGMRNWWTFGEYLDVDLTLNWQYLMTELRPEERFHETYEIHKEVCHIFILYKREREWEYGGSW